MKKYQKLLILFLFVCFKTEAQENTVSSLDLLKTYVPDFAKSSINSKTLDYMQFVSNSWPLEKANKREDSFRGSNTLYNYEKRPISNGISMNTCLGHMDGIDDTESEFLTVGFVRITEKSDTSSEICNIVSFNGNIFPLKPGNSMNTSVECSSILKLNDYQSTMKRNINTISTVIDYVDASSLDLAMAVQGKVFVIGQVENVKQSESHLGEKIDSEYKYPLTQYFSESTSSFIPLKTESNGASTVSTSVKFTFIE